MDPKWLALVGAVSAAALLLPWFGPEYYVLSATNVYLYIVLAVAWTIFSGPTGYVSLATATFYGVGIYVTALYGDYLSLPFLALAGGLASLVFGLFVGLICLRLSGFYFAVFTFGLSELIRHCMLWWEHNVTGTVGRWVTSSDEVAVYYTMLAVVALTIAAAWGIRRSRFGLALTGLGESETAAEHIGINVTGHRIAFFAISCFFMGMAGAVMATKFTYVDPNSAFNPLISFTPVLMSLFGGLGRVYGPVVGAVLLTFLSEVLLTRFPHFYTLIYGIIFVVVILFLPKGLVGLMASASGRKAAER